MASAEYALRVLTITGPLDVAIFDEDERSRVGEHWAAIGRSLDGYDYDNDMDSLAEFEGETIWGFPLDAELRVPEGAKPQGFDLEWRADVVLALGQAGEIDPDGPYPVDLGGET